MNENSRQFVQGRKAGGRGRGKGTEQLQVLSQSAQLRLYCLQGGNDRRPKAKVQRETRGGNGGQWAIGGPTVGDKAGGVFTYVTRCC